MLRTNLNDEIMLFGKKISVSGGDNQSKKAPLVDEMGKLKKPDKILSCPRCNSMDTKFCYYNNYNANQPRHFCRACQRYWTAGGSMRSVPVGAGRRKNKNSPSFSRHVSHHDAPKRADNVLSFSNDDCSSSVTVSEEGKSKRSKQQFVAPYFATVSWPYPAPFCGRVAKEDDCGWRSRADEPNQTDRGLVLQANPAALSRSTNFLESA